MKKLRMVMIRMDRVSYKILLIALSLSLPIHFVLAQDALIVKTNLVGEARTAGYTFNLAKLAIGVPGGAISTDARVWLRAKKKPTNFPEYLKLVGKVHAFNIKASTPVTLTQPLWLARQLKHVPYYQRSFYYYDRQAASWVKLPTNYDTATKQLRTTINLASFEVAVFDDTRYQFGPVPQSNFVAFGDINAVAAIAIDDSTGVTLYEKNTDTVRSIASLTKLMTAYVLLQNNVSFDRVVTYHSQYDRIGGGLHVSEGETLTMGNLLYGMVVGSANNAAVALMNHAGYTQADFIQLMDAEAKTLGLNQTSFADPSGLEVGNQSTVADYAKFLRTAWDNDMLTALSTTKYYSFSTINTKVFHDFNNTNSLLRTSSLDITGSKTGYIDEALYCLALKAKEGNHEVITVVLGSPTSSARFNESERLMQWAFKNYHWSD